MMDVRSLRNVQILGLCMIIYLIGSASGGCGICSDASVACVAQTKFRVCTNNVMSGDVFSCPAHTVCIANDPICVDEHTARPFCNTQCDECDSNGKFACINETSYAFCFGCGKSNVINSCPSNLVCSHSNPPEFCVDPSKMPADCQEYGTSITTAAPSVCPGPGRFPIWGTDCRQYTYCFYLDKVLRYQTYFCPGSTVFNPGMQQCVVSSDYKCTA